MKKKIVISINPEFVEKIRNGEKRYEYRTRVAKQDIDAILIYETYPVKRVVAEAEIIDIVCLPKEELWALTKDKSGINKCFFDQYFMGKEFAYAYKLGNVKFYDSPKELSEIGIKTAPQSFMYV